MYIVEATNKKSGELTRLTCKTLNDKVLLTYDEAQYLVDKVKENPLWIEPVIEETA